MGKTKLIGVLLGEACGIGPELIVKTLAHQEIREKVCWYIVGDYRVFQQGEEIAKLKIEVEKVSENKDIDIIAGKIYFRDLENLSPNDYKIGELSKLSGKITGDSIIEIVRLSKKVKMDGILYGPFNKQALQLCGRKFKDELHFYADIFGYNDKPFGELNILDDLWISRVTSHIPMAEVANLITKELVYERIAFANKYLRDAGVDNPNIYVASYNPHNGEGGLLGQHEVKEIAPAVLAAKADGINAFGPYPADTIFLRRDKEKVDCILSMFHDQAQIGIKLLGFYRGVTLSAGFPIPLATPAHGTAFDIAGKGIANEGATLAAVKILFRLNHI